MSDKTAGQQAYEARLASRAAWLGPHYGIGQFNRPWNELSDNDQADEEAAAAAVETEQVRLARQDRDQLRKAALDLAAELENEAARTYSAALRLLGNPAGLVLEEQAEAKRSAAIRIRKIAEPPS